MSILSEYRIEILFNELLQHRNLYPTVKVLEREQMIAHL